MGKVDPRHKYEHHDLHIEDVSSWDLQNLRSQAIRKLVDTPENDNVRAIIDTFMSHLVAKGFRIVKVKKDESK